MTETLQGRIVVYSILGCPYCMKAKQILTDLNLPFIDVRLDLYPHIKEEVSKHSEGRVTVPQIFFNDSWVGGHAELTKLVDDKTKLQEFIDKVKTREHPSDQWPLVPDPSTAVVEADSFGIPCEKDEYFELLEQLKTAGVVKSQGFFSKKNVLHSNDFVKWVKENKDVKDDAQAAEIGQALIDRQFISHEADEENVFSTKSGKKYTVNDFRKGCALNSGDPSACLPQNAGRISEHLRKMTLKLFAKYLSADGKAVDYKGMKGSEEFKEYKKLTLELQRLDIQRASRDEKLAFFINIYNALVIHSNIETGPPTNLWGRYKFFNNTKYIIGGQVYSLQDIENGVLRSNRKGVGQCCLPFGNGDRRLKVSLDQNEPLIHFALVCGAKSCPPIKTYSVKNVHSALKLAAAGFLEEDEGCMLDVDKKTVSLSSIFKWYRVDFGKDDKELLEFVAAHMSEGEKKQKLENLISGGSFKVNFLKYDWSVNEKK